LFDHLAFAFPQRGDVHAGLAQAHCHCLFGRKRREAGHRVDDANHLAVVRCWRTHFWILRTGVKVGRDVAQLLRVRQRFVEFDGVVGEFGGQCKIWSEQNERPTVGLELVA
jgi:hypothetical protein